MVVDNLDDLIIEFAVTITLVWIGLVGYNLGQMVTEVAHLAR